MTEEHEEQEKHSKAEFEGPTYKTAFDWKSEKKTPEDQYHKMLLGRNWSDAQRLSEQDYDDGVSQPDKPEALPTQLGISKQQQQKPHEEPKPQPKPQEEPKPQPKPRERDEDEDDERRRKGSSRRW